MSTPAPPMITPGLDALSSLIKHEAKACGVEVRLSGHGHQDVHSMLLSMYNNEMRCRELETAVKDVMEYLQAQKLPEEIYGYCVACVLKARVNWELKVKN